MDRTDPGGDKQRTDPLWLETMTVGVIRYQEKGVVTILIIVIPRHKNVLRDITIGTMMFYRYPNVHFFRNVSIEEPFGWWTMESEEEKVATTTARVVVVVVVVVGWVEKKGVWFRTEERNVSFLWILRIITTIVVGTTVKCVTERELVKAVFAIIRMHVTMVETERIIDSRKKKMLPIIHNTSEIPTTTSTEKKEKETHIRYSMV